MQGKLIVVLEGGTVSAIVGTADLVGCNVTVIDYDTEDADKSDVQAVKQHDGSDADAYVSHDIVEEAGIGTDGFPDFAAAAAKPGALEAFFEVAAPAMAEFGDYRINGLMKSARAEAASMRAALEAAEHWLTEEAESPEPGATKPDEILRVIRAAIPGAEGRANG